MRNSNDLVNELLAQKKDLEFQLKEINFKGYPEVKEISGKKYIYLRYKKYDRLSSKYAGVYTESFYNDLKELAKSVKELNSKLRSVKTKLAKLGVNIDNLDSKVLINLDFIRNNLNTIIYGQAIVEGVSATFLDTEEILEKGSCKNVSFDDTLTILNLKNAWQYVLDEDTVRRGTTFDVLCTIAGYVNDRQISYPDQIRTTNVIIGGCSYRPEIPTKEGVIRNIDQILNSKNDDVSKAIDLLCYLAKTQVFSNGNKRTALIFANTYLISHGLGYISVPDNLDKEYKLLLVEFYESKNNKVKDFLLKKAFFSL
ncbi:MAG: Fic family protein [Bacilli bacterium]|nr:Fic family protein [Bacilli bacterium]